MGASPTGISIVSYRDYLPFLNVFLKVQQAFCRYWAERNRTKQQIAKYGAFCAPTTRRRARVFFDSPDYHFYVACKDGQPEAYADACLQLPFFPEWEQEMWEEVEAQGGKPGTFFARWNKGLFNFGVVCYLYYVLKASMSTSLESMYPLFRRVVEDMRKLGCHCMMTDLPIKIAGQTQREPLAGEKPKLPRITELALSFGFLPSAIFVFDTDGNVWQQYCYILKGRPVTVADKLRDAGLQLKDLPNSFVWQQICEANGWDQASSQLRLAEIFKSATNATAFFDAVVAVAA